MSRINAELIAKALKGKRVGRDFVAHCPAHDDRNPSLSIKDTKMVASCSNVMPGAPSEQSLAAS